MSKEEGFKETKGKLKWSLLPTQALQGCVRVLMFGAETKYAPNNWKKVEPQGAYLDATYRHLNAFLEGNELDKESGESHLSHALCDLLFLEYHRMNRDPKISFETYLKNILDYPEYTSGITSKEN